MLVRVKICGITTATDAQLAAGAGADALGFIFYRESARYVAPEIAAAIISELPPFVTPVGVFVNSTAEEVNAVVRMTRVRAIQLHGDESPEFCTGFDLPVIKALRVRDAATIAAAREFNTAALLLDSYVPGQLGGTGAKFNWDLAVEAKALGKPIILAGGLTPDNVRDATMKVQPYGLDVSSGVEFQPGRKYPKRVQEFIYRAKTV